MACITFFDVACAHRHGRNPAGTLRTLYGYFSLRGLIWTKSSYDLAKFQYFFNENKAQLGTEIVPCHNLQKEMSSGVSYGEQLVYDIERLRRHFPAVPVKVMLIDVDEEGEVIITSDTSLIEPLEEAQ